MDNQDLNIQRQNQLIQNQDWKIQQQNQLINNQAREIESLQRLENEVKILESKARIRFSPPTCEHWAMYGANQNGAYMVDPDGDMQGNPPFMAYCDFSTNSTEVLHDSENEIKIPKCSGTDCRHEHPITYQATDSQIESLKSLSQGCKQSITFGCFLAPMKWYSKHHGWWTDRSGNPHYCTDCQCNSKKPEWMEDEMSTEDLNLLPMKSFVYGPLKYDLEEANVSIGRLSCSGLKESSGISSVSSLPEIVQEMKRIEGEMIDGFQEVQDLRDGKAEIVEEIGEIREALEDVSHASSVGTAFFSANKNSGGFFACPVTFDNVDIDTGNQLDKESGVFTCKIPGTYLFTFSGFASSTGLDYVGVYVNNVKKVQIADRDMRSNIFNHLSYTWTLQLSLDDQVQLKVDAGKFYSDYEFPIYFTGLLVHADAD